MEFEPGHQYEYDKTKNALDDLKVKIRKWLDSTYDDPKSALKTFDIMQETVEKVSKRQVHNIDWASAGSPDWHGRYYHYISKWIKLENELGVITAKMFMSEGEFEFKEDEDEEV